MMSSKVSRFFKPSLIATAMLFLLAVLFAKLGVWQAKRGEEKGLLAALGFPKKTIRNLIWTEGGILVFFGSFSKIADVQPANLLTLLIIAFSTGGAAIFLPFGNIYSACTALSRSRGCLLSRISSLAGRSAESLFRSLAPLPLCLCFSSRERLAAVRASKFYRLLLCT